MSIYSHDERILKDTTQQHTLISVFTLPAFVSVQRSNSSSYVIQVFTKIVRATQVFVYYLPWREIPSELLITAERIKSVFWKCKKPLLLSFRSILASDQLIKCGSINLATPTAILKVNGRRAWSWKFRRSVPRFHSVKIWEVEKKRGEK